MLLRKFGLNIHIYLCNLFVYIFSFRIECPESKYPYDLISDFNSQLYLPGLYMVSNHV